MLLQPVNYYQTSPLKVLKGKTFTLDTEQHIESINRKCEEPNMTLELMNNFMNLKSISKSKMKHINKGEEELVILQTISEGEKTGDG